MPILMSMSMIPPTQEPVVAVVVASLAFNLISTLAPLFGRRCCCRFAFVVAQLTDDVALLFK